MLKDAENKSKQFGKKREKLNTKVSRRISENKV
jgi:hypothetical protein